MPRPTVPAIIIFGSGANPASEIGVFGSYASPNFTNNLTTMQSSTQYARGWFTAVLNNNRQFIQDQNCVDYIFSNYLFYLMTIGVPEYIAAMVYWTNSIIQVSGQFFISLVDNNTGNTPASSPTQWQPGIPGMEMSGVIKSYAGILAPTGYLLCQGQAVSRATYATLFNVCGTQYGAGDGSTTFNIPNLQGRIPLGAGTGTDADGNTESFTMGQVGGEFKHILTISELPPQYYPSSFTQVQSGTGNSNPMTSPVQGGGQGMNVLQPFLTINYIIKT